MSEMVLLGDEAVALAAVHAGLTAAYAYPGTPSTEILEYLDPVPAGRTAARGPSGAPTRRRRTKRPSACPSPAAARWWR